MKRLEKVSSSICALCRADCCSALSRRRSTSTRGSADCSRCRRLMADTSLEWMKLPASIRSSASLRTGCGRRDERLGDSERKPVGRDRFGM